MGGAGGGLGTSDSGMSYLNVNDIRGEVSAGLTGTLCFHCFWESRDMLNTVPWEIVTLVSNSMGNSDTGFSSMGDSDTSWHDNNFLFILSVKEF